MKEASLLFLALLLPAACAAPRPAAFGPGEIRGDVYRNDFFGFSLPIPDLADVQNRAQLDRLTKDFIPPSDTEPTLLLALRLKPSLPLSGDDAVITCLTEKPAPSSGIKNGADYLEKMRGTMSAQRLEVSVDGPAATRAIGGVDFASQRFRAKTAGETFEHQVYAAMIGDRAFVVSIAFDSPEGLARAEKALSSASFRR